MILSNEAIKLLQPQRKVALEELKISIERLKNLLDGRDLRPNFDRMRELVDIIEQRQAAADLMGGYVVEQKK